MYVCSHLSEKQCFTKITFSILAFICHFFSKSLAESPELLSIFSFGRRAIIIIPLEILTRPKVDTILVFLEIIRLSFCPWFRIFYRLAITNPGIFSLDIKKQTNILLSKLWTVNDALGMIPGGLHSFCGDNSLGKARQI